MRRQRPAWFEQAAHVMAVCARMCAAGHQILAAHCHGGDARIVAIAQPGRPIDREPPILTVQVEWRRP